MEKYVSITTNLFIILEASPRRWLGIAGGFTCIIEIYLCIVSQ